MSIFQGSGVAIVTPFKEDGKVNFDSFEKMIDFQIENGTDALIVCGTTGEASTLTDDEHIEVIKFAVDITKKRIPVVGGAGSNHTVHGIELCKKCQAAGVDGLLIVTPYYNKTTQKGIIKYYSSIAGSVDLPIIAYNVAVRTGLNITPKTMYELSKIENIVGVKEASGNISQVAEMAYLCGDSIDIYSGNDDMILPVLSLGGKGVISVLANIAPKDTHDMIMKFLNGDIKESIEIQLRAFDLIKNLFSEVNPIPVKAALNIMGMKAGGYREPLLEMENNNFEMLKNAMKNYGLI